MTWSRTTLARAWRSNRLWRERWAGARGVFNTAWEDYLKKDPMMSDVIAVVTISTGGGRLRRYATFQGKWVADAGAGGTKIIGVDALLQAEPEISSTYNMGNGSSSSRSFSLTFGSPDINPWRTIKEQGRFFAGWAELSLIPTDSDFSWEDRFVVMRGDMSGGVSFGTSGEAINVSINDPKATVDLAVTDFVFDFTRWDETGSDALPEQSVGLRYPLAINEPGRVLAVRVTVADPPTFMVGYTHEINVTTVHIDGGSALAPGNTVFPWTILYKQDNRGTDVTCVRFTAGTGTWEDNSTVYANISQKTGVLTHNVIGSIRYLAEHWSLLGPVGTDNQAFARADSKVRVATGPGIYINGSNSNDATRALEYIEGTICSDYPMITMAWQPGGYGPIITDRRAPVVAKWVVGKSPIFKRVAPWQESSKEEIFNSFTYRYNYNAIEDIYMSVVTRTPQNSLLCQISEEQAGPRDYDPIDSTLVVDAATGNWVADWLVDHYALPSYYTEYEGASSVLLKYALGDNIDLVDTEIYGVTESNPVKATIEKIVYHRGYSLVGLRIWALFPSISGGAFQGDTVNEDDYGQ